MLTHELKTPLSVVRTVLSRPSWYGHPSASGLQTEALHAVQEMGEVIERCVQVGQVADGLTVARPREVVLDQEITDCP